MRRFAKGLGLALVALTLSLALPQAALAETITFSEIAPTANINGVTIMGVTFSFTIGGVPSGMASIGMNTGPGLTPFNMPPNIEGAANGILTLDFASPVDMLSFGSHIATAGPVTPGLTVQLFDPSLAPIGGPIPLNMLPAPLFAGGQFNYTGAPVRRAVIDFNEAQAQLGRFTVDTITFQVAGAAVVPEPSTVALLGLGGLGLAGYGWCRSRRKA